jgi:hypothetical protein
MKPIRYLNRGITVICLLAIVMAGLASTGCPKKDGVRKAVEASYRLPAMTNDIITQVTAARDKGIITLEQSKAFGDQLNKLAQAEIVYVGMVKALQNAIDNGQEPAPGQLISIKTFFDASIVEPFLRVLEMARILSGPAVELILVAITAARLVIRTIASGIGSTKKKAIDRAAILTSNNWSNKPYVYI